MLKHLCAGAVLLSLGSAVASAAPFPAPIDSGAGIVLVRGGCGPGFHPNPFGECVPNRRAFFGPGPVVGRLPPPCPRGYHRDPDPLRRLCYPNF